MVKAKSQEEPSTKPKFHQTKLCFSSFAPADVNKKETDTPKFQPDYTKKLEMSIKELNIGKDKRDQINEHADPCKDCNGSVKRVKCTAIKEKTKEACNLSYCVDCIKKKVNESLEWIQENKDAQFVYKDGITIKHVKTSRPKWACLVCRGLCDCKLCSESISKVARLSFNIEPTIKKKEKTTTIINIQPPELTSIKLLYSEEEIWIRLQIREFIFRFGDLYQFENRVLSSLQNVQGDWRIKKFGAYIVWQFLVIIYNTSLYEYPQEEKEESVALLAKKTLNSWISDKKLDNLYFDKEAKHHALLEVLNKEGMTGRGWQDIAEILALAEFKDIPVPTSRDVAIMQKQKKEDDMMDVDDDEEEELNLRIKRYQKSTNRSLLSVEDELKMINMLLELLLFDVQIRQSLVAAGQKTMTKELRDEELEFKKYQKEWAQENLKNLSNRTSLSNRVTQLQATKGKDLELKQAQTDLDALETLIRDGNHNLSKRKLELAIHILKQEKRMKPVGCDMLGNEYWIFNDILDHLNNATDYRNSEPYWAYGIIVIGPGFNKENTERTWWYIKGKDDMKLLKDWITNQAKQQKDNEDELKRIASGISDRIEYLVALETVVYGEGFFQ